MDRNHRRKRASFDPKSELLDKTVDRHARRLMGIHRAYRKDELEDLRQELLLAAFKCWNRFDPAKSSIQTFLNRVLKNRATSLVRLKRLTDDLDSAESVIRSLALTIEARDAYTKGHCQRLARYSTALGEALTLDDDQLGALERGGYLHDLGKIGVPDSVLLKPGALTPAEYEVMKQHTVIGDRLCGRLRSLQPVRPIVRHHHEHLDGSGYPDGLRGSAVPLLAQIVSIADLYDAVTTERPYRPARSPAVAFEELRVDAERGLRDPELVRAFVALGRNGVLDRTRMMDDDVIR